VRHGQLEAGVEGIGGIGRVLTLDLDEDTSHQGADPTLPSAGLLGMSTRRSANFSVTSSRCLQKAGSYHQFSTTSCYQLNLVTSKTSLNLNFHSPTESFCTSVNHFTIMPSEIAQKAKAVLKKSCPDLARGVKNTTSSAIHDSVFVGTLRRWPNFEVDVENTCASFNWTQLGQVLSHKPNGIPGPAYLSYEHIICGDVTGVQGRFQNNVRQVMSAALQAVGQFVAF
jgi:hypothetical protein